MDVNVTGTANLMTVAAGRVEAVVHLSSIAVYGDIPPEGGAVDEDHATAPTSLYGVSKLGAEMAARCIARQAGLKLTVLRCGPVFGPFEYETGLRDMMSPHLQMLRLARRRETAVLAWRLAADWIYSRDVAAAVVQRLATSEQPEALFNLSGSDVTDLTQWGDLLARRYAGWTWRLAAAHESPNVVYGFASRRAALDNARIAAAGFRPAFDLPRAAAHFIDWADRHDGALQPDPVTPSPATGTDR
jgi:nucleoside-diphosphate-sugar epimerase